MATCVIIGSAETRIIERGDTTAAGLHAALFRGRQDMIDARRSDLLDAGAGRHVRQRRPADQERPRCRAHAPRRSCRRSPAPPLFLETIASMRCASSSARSSASRERPARKDIGRIRHAKRRLDRIDAAHEIGMLRRGLERRQFLPAEREEDPARRRAKQRGGLGRTVDGRPAVARTAAPRPDGAAR